MPPHSTNESNPENKESSTFTDVSLSKENKSVEPQERKHKIIVIHGRKYDISHFNHPGK